MTDDVPKLGPRPRWLLGAFDAVAGVVEGVAFWVAVALPLLYVPPVALGAPGLADPPVLALLVGANAVAVVLGYGHNRPGADRDAAGPGR